jgi:PQQ-dependent dehydrogenase (methanol/ethanol family)
VSKYQWLSIAVTLTLVAACSEANKQDTVPEERPEGNSAGNSATSSATSSATNTETKSGNRHENTELGRFADVDAARIIAADTDNSVWLTHGRTYAEDRYSPLDQVNADTVKDLGLRWWYDLGVSRGIEVTPIVVDGVMYVTGLWNIVTALDATTGEKLWDFDPEIDRKKAVHLCCDAVNRGVAVWKGRIYMGTIDGRLIALDAQTGVVEYDIVTVDQAKPYTITGAPRIVGGKVIIGNGGAEYGVRGYVSAYDAESGSLLWRFYTVPGNPGDGFENDAIRTAAKTWNGEWWKIGGGGTVWDSVAYDPDLNLLYIGVGNGSPWNQEVRSPGGGDNLYLSSIVALNADTGDYVWHYQTTPGDTWDYTATQHMILADLKIDGRTRKVIMQAPKNGFFYVIDRETGEFISAKNFVPVNWATHIDEITGRPVEIEAARYPGKDQPYIQLPGPLGAHNWHPMSMSRDTGYVYIPAQEVPFAYGEDKAFQYRPGLWNTGTNPVLNTFPDDAATIKALRASAKGRLIAWDPVKQAEVWRVEHRGPWNGGVLSTGGNLVFQGTAGAKFSAYSADKGEKLWSFGTRTGVVAAPITYEIDGIQYVAVAAGWGGAYPLILGGVFPSGSKEPKLGRILVFSLGPTNELPPLVKPIQVKYTPPVDLGDDAQVALGRQVYAGFCVVCHGERAQSYGSVPNLKYSGVLGDAEAWKSIVVDGALAENGMVGFGEYVAPEQAEAIRAYVIREANSDKDAKDYKTSGGS